MSSFKDSEKCAGAGFEAGPGSHRRRSAAWTGRYCLVKDMNCGTATLEAFQDVFGLRDDLLLKAATGLEGGVVAGGSTCGVITAGALGLAQLWREKTALPPGESVALMGLVADYVAWFTNTVGTTLYRERTGVDFYSAAGQARYFLPGDRVLRCISHIGTALAYLEKAGTHIARPDRDTPDRPAVTGHCASMVLEGIRSRTCVGHRRIDEIAAALSGGVGLSGGVCGALTGAIMGINLVFGMDVRQRNRPGIMRDFAVGHINLLTRHAHWMPEPFGVGRQIVGRFTERAGSRRCRSIVGRPFADRSDFSSHLAASAECRELIGFSAGIAAEAIERWR